MDFNDIGSIIVNARKSKGMTQDDLAEKLHLTRQAISNWETNKALPDIGIILRLCKTLDLDFNKFIGVANNGIKAEDVINYEKKKMTKKTFIIITILSIFFILICFTIFMILNKNAFAVYDVYLDSNEFSLNNAILVKSKINNYFKLGTLKNNLDNIPLDTVYNIKLYSIKDGKESILLEQKYEDNLKVSEEYGNNKYFSSDIYDTEKLYLEIEYTINDKPYKYTYPLKLEVNFESNRLFYGKGKDVKKNDNIVFEVDKLYIDKLIINGYSYEEKDDLYIREFKNGNFTYYVNSNYLVYIYEDKNKTQSIKYYLSDKHFEISEYDYMSNVIITKLNYYINNKKINCVVGDCKNYEDYLDIIREELKRING